MNCFAVFTQPRPDRAEATKSSNGGAARFVTFGIFAGHGVKSPCVDGSPLARVFFEVLQGWSVRPCVRPHMMISPSMIIRRRRSEASSLPTATAANLTSGGMMIPTTVPHSGRESFEGTAPLCEDGDYAPRRTTATFPRITVAHCCRSVPRI